MPSAPASIERHGDDDDDGENDEDDADREDDEWLMISIDKPWLLKLQSALQDHFFRNKSGDSVSFSQFRDLVRKLDRHSSNNNRAERSWHDLVCVGHPSLYRLSTMDHPTATATTTATTVVASSSNHIVASAPRLICHRFKGNRWKELRRLMQVAQKRGVRRRVSRQIRAAMKASDIHADQTMTANSENHDDPDDNDDDRSDDGDGKPKAKRKSLDAGLAPTSSDNNNGSSSSSRRMPSNIHAEGEATRDPRSTGGKRLKVNSDFNDPQQIEERLQVANVLHAHARHILRRQNAAPNNGSSSSLHSTANSSSCALIFSDVVGLFPNRTIHQISSLLKSIHAAVPGWLRIMDAAAILDINSNRTHKPFSNDATIWISTDGFDAARSELGGKTSEGGKKDDQKMPSSSDRMQGSNANVASMPNTATHPDNHHHRNNGSNDDNNDDTATYTIKKKRATTTTIETRATKALRASSSAASLPSTKNGTSSRSAAASNGHFQQQQQQQPRYDQEQLREASTCAAQQHPQQQNGIAKKRRPELRINPNFILCDEDHDGGCIIQPTFNSPRSLKRLMDRMNVGERI